MSKKAKSTSVLVHPDFSIARTLRGYKNFEDVYQGKSSANSTIWLSDRQSGKDPQADIAFAKLQGQINSLSGVIPPGGLDANDTQISPWFQRGIPVPLGATIVLWLPYLQANAIVGEAPVPIGVRYIVGWRTRDVSVFNQRREPFHQGVSGAGATDNGAIKNFEATGAAVPIFTGQATARRTILAAFECVRYAQAEPTLGSEAVATEDLWALELRLNPEQDKKPSPPLFPYFKTQPAAAPGVVLGDLSQGVLVNGGPTSNPYGAGALLVPVTMKCKGDELLLGVQLEPTGFIAPAWNFDNNAYNLSLFFGRAGFATGFPALAPLGGNKQLGAYISTGSAPLDEHAASRRTAVGRRRPAAGRGGTDGAHGPHGPERIGLRVGALHRARPRSAPDGGLSAGRDRARPVGVGLLVLRSLR